MKNIKLLLGILCIALLTFSCEREDVEVLSDEANLAAGNAAENNPFANATWIQEDQMARPAINTVFVSSGSKDQFNVTIPSEQFDAFQPMFQANLEGLSPAYSNPGDMNALGLTAAQFSGFLATDVLNVSLDGPTTFFDGNPNNTLTGRTLADDVITVELILIFGGEDGLTANPENPGLIDDHVDANDKPFLAAFPYLASPW